MPIAANPGPLARLVSFFQRMFSPFESEELAEQEGDTPRRDDGPGPDPADSRNRSGSSVDGEEEDDNWGPPYE
jgi:hypothetical protein